MRSGGAIVIVTPYLDVVSPRAEFYVRLILGHHAQSISNTSSPNYTALADVSQMLDAVYPLRYS
jgi:hypothetical protein